MPNWEMLVPSKPGIEFSAMSAKARFDALVEGGFLC
jgi:hypothetical protein